MTVLDRIVEYKREEIRAAKADIPLSALDALITEQGPPRGFLNALERKAATGFSLIAEIKKASPSKGLIRENFNPAQHAHDYETGGAACLSVLTDGPSFQGGREALEEARAAVGLPVLRKDFMLDPYQCAEARAWGADCILLIMACLSDELARDLEDAARHYGLDVLVEVHDQAELERALTLKTRLIGINNRDLHQFSTTLETTARLAALCPHDRFLISESGIGSHADLQILKGYGARGFLVGESLMRKKDLRNAVRELLVGDVDIT